ncbi:MAG: hypothetical protein IKJ65_03540 [Clostridia bacterium]|nr:hypothetical protein [Clostridia bacterium]
MTANRRLDARKRMSGLLVSEEIQKRIARLPVKRAEFAEDLLSGVAASEKNAGLNESEVFALFELAAKMNIRLNEEEGNAYLAEMNGHPAVTMDFANLHKLYRLIHKGEQSA